MLFEVRFPPEYHYAELKWLALASSGKIYFEMPFHGTLSFSLDALGDFNSFSDGETDEMINVLFNKLTVGR